MPWQSGMTGDHRTARTWRRTSTRSDDLFDPKYKGKVDMLTEMRDTVPLVMTVHGGSTPNKASDARLACKAIDKLKRRRRLGQIRRFTGNDYAKDLTSGNASAADRLVGRRGAASGRQPEHRVADARPRAACLWADNMEIPVGAPNATAAEAFMN